MSVFRQEDFFFWGVIKENCCANKPEAILHFNAIAEKRLHTLEKVHEHWLDRMRYCEASHFPFHF